MVVVFVVPVVFLLGLWFYVVSLRLLWGGSWEKKAKVVVVFVVVFVLKIRRRGRWWDNLQRRGNAKTFRRYGTEAWGVRW